MKTIVARLIADDRGQDLIEYALLTATLAFATIAGVNALGTAMNSSYASWDTAGQSNALVEPRDPQ